MALLAGAKLLCQRIENCAHCSDDYPALCSLTVNYLKPESQAGGGEQK